MDEQGILLKKGKVVDYQLGNDYDCFEPDYAYSKISNKEGQWFLLDDLERKNFNKIIHEKINGTWIASYYYDIFYKNDISEIKKYEPYWDTDWRTSIGEEWQDTIYPTNIYIADNYFIIYTNDDYIREYLIVDENDDYDFDVLLGNKFSEPDYPSKTNFIHDYKEIGSYQFKLQIDGDYLTLYDKKNNKLLMEFARTRDYDKDRENLREIANNNKISLSNINWPRHADGTCDYDDEIKPPKVQLSDNDSVSEEEEETATPSDTLSENEEDIETVEETVLSAKKSSSLPFVIIVASAVIMLLFIVIVLIVRKKKKQ